MKVILLGAISVVIAGCAAFTGNWQAVDPGPKPDYETTVALVEAAIRDSLRDPEAGQFKNWTPLFKTYHGLANVPVWSICVEVNGKNAYGGYSGFAPWFAHLDAEGRPIQSPAGMGEQPLQCRQAYNPARH